MSETLVLPLVKISVRIGRRTLRKKPVTAHGSSTRSSTRKGTYQEAYKKQIPPKSFHTPNGGLIADLQREKEKSMPQTPLDLVDAGDDEDHEVPRETLPAVRRSTSIPKCFHTIFPKIRLARLVR